MDSVLQEKFDNAKQWIMEVINRIPSLLSERDYKIFESRYEILPLALLTNAPLGAKCKRTYMTLTNGRRRKKIGIQEWNQRNLAMHGRNEPRYFPFNTREFPYTHQATKELRYSHY